MNVVTPKEMSVYDQLTINSGIPSQELMEKAGKECSEVIKEIIKKDQSVLIVCGSGNNGGDGQVIAHYLNKDEYNVTVLFTADEETIKSKFSKESFNNFIRLQQEGIKLLFIAEDKLFKEIIPEYNVIIDCIFGTGMDNKRELSSYYKELINQINQCQNTVIAIDIPSGLNGLNGLFNSAVRADYTIAIQSIKTGELLEFGPDYSGNLLVVDIGIDTDQEIEDNHISKELIRQEDLKFPYTREKNSYKYHYGRVIIVAGSKGMLGAASLAAQGALRMGVGLVTNYVEDDVYEASVSIMPVEALVQPYPHVLTSSVLENVKREACLFGPGLGRNYNYGGLLDYLLSDSKPLVIDADGLWMIKNNLDQLKQSKAPIIITPHYGEFAQLLDIPIDQLKDDPIFYASTFAQEYNVIVILKSHNTLVVSPDGRVYFNTTGNAGMATPGSGDVLAGMTTAILAHGIEPLEAAKAAVFYHGAAGDYYADKYNQTTLLATDIIKSLKEVLPK